MILINFVKILIKIEKKIIKLLFDNNNYGHSLRRKVCSFR